MEKARIMIIENESIIAADIRNILDKCGYYTAGVFARGEEAIEKIEELYPDLVLMDIKLAGSMDGVETARLIRDCSNAPVIYLTAFADEDTLQRAKITEPYGYLLKPVDEKALNAAIEIAISKSNIERKLRESEGRFRSLVEATSDWVWEMDEDLVYTYVSPKIRDIMGYEPEALLGKTPVTLMPPDEARRLAVSFSSIIASQKAFNILENKNIHRDGHQLVLETSGVPFFDRHGKFRGYRGIHRDITKRKKAEEALKRSREELRRLSAHLESVREKERARVAREIHDELGQSLTALKMDISWLNKRVPEDQKALHEKTESMSGLVDKTIQTVKRISSELRPGLLDDLGLVAAIEWEAEDFQKRTEIKCELNLPPFDIVLDQDRSTALFRILQETLTNVIRHAKATKVKISLVEKNNTIVMKVKDNGKGIPEETTPEPESFGLIGIRERVRSFGGKVKIQGIEGKGTTVTVGIPLLT